MGIFVSYFCLTVVHSSFYLSSSQFLLVNIIIIIIIQSERHDNIIV